MKEIRFVKSEGAGNDFVIVDELDTNYNLSAQKIRKMCDRHFGVGADGLLLARPSSAADFQMLFFNPDGSQAEMCGNGIRCFGKYLYDHGRTKKEEIIIETKSGFRVLTLEVAHGDVASAKVDMGKPSFIARMVPVETGTTEFVDVPLKVNGSELKATCLSMGNPHCVVFVDSLDNYPVAEFGPKMEILPIFPEKINTEFVQVISRREIKLKVWERGAGLTLACGTGACAAVAASVKKGLTDRTVSVNLPGGSLQVQWSESGSIYLSGPASEVFSGTIKL